MQLKPTEITSILKDQIANYESTGDVAEVGTVVQVGDGIARVHGLRTPRRLRRSSSPMAS